MREMKDSGIEWIGQIPADWKLMPLKFVVNFNKGLPITKVDLTESGIPVVSYGQIHSKLNSGTSLKKELVRFVGNKYLVSNIDSLGKNGDIFFADTSEDYAGIGNAVLIDTDEGIFAGYHTIIAHPNNVRYSKYLAYLFLSDAWRNQIRASASGIKVFSVTQNLLKRSYVLQPSVHEAEAIADFLDAKCEEIDRLTADIQSQIDTLEQYKRSLIFETVTKGLDPNVPMKDSGIEWIGKIPADWDTVRLAFCLDEVNVNNKPVKTNNILSLIKDKGVVPYEEKGNQGNKSKDDINEYKLAYPNTLVVNSMNVLIGSVGLSKYFGCVSPVYYVFKATKSSDLRFINYIFTTRQFQKELRKYANGILEIRLRVSAKDIFKRKIPIPSKQEQQAIADFLDAKCQEIDEVVATKCEQLNVLADYKKALIFEYVTGKKEVACHKVS